MDKQVAIILKLIDQASPGLASAASGMANALKGITNNTDAATNAMSSAWKNSVGAIVGHIGNLIKQTQLASLLIGGGLVAAVTNAVNMAAEFERFGKAAVYLTGSAKAADEFAGSVRRLSVDTMFNIDQIAKMNSLLIGNTKDTKLSENTLRSLTDAVAATGGGYSELEGVTRAWIQTNSKAKASSEELNRQFANANIPVIRVLAEHIVKDVNSPLRQYIETASAAGGASKKLTTAYEKANDTLKWTGAELTNAKQKLDEWSKSGKHAESSVNALKLSIQKKEAALGKATGTIGEYTAAQNKASTANVKAKLTVKDVMAQLQSIGDLNIPGSIAAAEISKALTEAYGGANQAMMKTFSFQFSQLQDNLKLTAMSFIGLDTNFKVVKGSILDVLTNAIMPINEWLKKNQDAIQKFASELAKSQPALIAFGSFIMGTIISALTLVVGPVLLLGALFGGLGYAIGLLIEKNGGFTKTLKDLETVFNNIKNVVQGVVGWFKQNLIIIEAVSITIASMLLPAIARLAVAYAVQLAQAIITAVVNYALLIGKMVYFVLESYLVIGALIAKTVQLGIATAAFIIHIAITGAYTAITAIATAATWAFNVALAILTSPITLVVLAIVTLIAIGVLLITHWDQVKTVAQTIWLGVQVLFSSVMSAISNVITSTWTAISNFLTGMWNGIKTKAMDIWSSITNGIQGMFSNLMGSAKSWGMGIISNMISGIKSAIKGAGKLAGKLLEGLGVSQEELMRFQHGGIVPGPIGQPVPIVAHGGERITPQGAVGVNGGSGGGPISINFYGSVTMDSEARVQELAQKISRVMGRQSELAQLGAAY